MSLVNLGENLGENKFIDDTEKSCIWYEQQHVSALLLIQQDSETQHNNLGFILLWFIFFYFILFILRKAEYPRRIDVTDLWQAFWHIALGT